MTIVVTILKNVNQHLTAGEPSNEWANEDENNLSNEGRQLVVVI